MTARGKLPSFWHGVGAALVLSLSGAALLGALTPMIGPISAFRAVIALLGLAYLLYLLGRSAERIGRVTTITLWLLATAVLWFVEPPLTAYVLAQVGMIWLVRCLYFYSSLLPALADLGLSVLGAAFAAWAASRSGSGLLALWCFFLAQAFFVALPAALDARAEPRPGARDDDDVAFDRAHRAAEAALRRLAVPR
jgi:hypothetical protein